jgi:thymidylate synthase
MSFSYSSDSLEDIHKTLMSTLYDDFDFESAPRGKPIRELIAASFTLTNPRNRIITSPARNVNYGFAVGELCWYIRGDDDLQTMQYYNKRMSQFSDDGKTINSAYGARMFNSVYKICPSGKFPFHPSQLDLVLEELKVDPDSRRAVMHINQPTDLGRAVAAGSKDIPCTMSVQLLIRNRKLHMHVLMRSNDVVWGMPYDVFSFTCLQEIFLYKLQELGVPVDDLGEYHHTAGSLHVYNTHFGMAKEVSKERRDDVTQMKPFTFGEIEELAHSDEPFVRDESWSDFLASPSYEHENDSIGWMFMKLVDHKNKRVTEERLKELTRITEELDLYNAEKKEI